MRPPNPLTNAEKAYIVGNYETKTVPTMARHLKRGVVTIYNFMDENAMRTYNPNYQGVKRTFVNRLMFFDENKMENWLVT